MSETVIKVENLSKSYLIGHQSQERYTVLRDVLANGAKNLGKRLLHPFNSSIGQRFNDSTEEFYALRDVSFEIKQGDRVGIIGRNGAGKSTLLKVLSRITEPTKGRVTIDGRVASLLEVGTGFHPELTGRENIFLNGAILGMSRVDIKRKFDEIVAFAEVEKFLDTPVKRYSSGMYVRLAFAVAAHLEPEILVVDEVLAVGDVAFQKKCLGKMEEVGKEGRTVLFVSHNLAAVKALCSRAILLDGGLLKSDRDVESVVSEYFKKTNSVRLCKEFNSIDFAPKNNSAILRKVSIVDGHGNLIERIDTDTSINVEIILEIIAENSLNGTIVSFYDNQNVCAFASISNHEEKWYGKPMELGEYKSICKIPKSFLNSGCYSIGVNLFGSNYSDQCFVRDVLKLNIQDGSLVRGDYFGQYSGLLRPQLEWHTERIS